MEPRRKPSQRRGLETVEAVLRAASDEIARSGLDRLTVRRIAETAGLSIGGVYGYFPNKEAIVTALITRWHERVFTVVDGIHPRFNTGLDLLSYLNQQVDRAAEIYKDQPGLGAMFDMLPAMPAVAAVVQGHDEAVLESLRSALRHYVPQAPAADIEAAAQAMPPICHELLLLAVSENSAGYVPLIKVLRACLVALATRLMTA